MANISSCQPPSRRHAVYAFAMDACGAVCLTEDMLDEWFRSLSPEEKGEIYDRALEGDSVELQLSDGMLRGTLADVVARIDKQATRLASTYQKATSPFGILGGGNDRQ